MRQHYDSNRTEDRSTSRDDHESDRGTFGWNDDREHRRSASRDRGPETSSSDYQSRWEDDRRRREGTGHDPKYGPDAHREGMPRDETERLIASSKVEGTPVFDRDGGKLGTVCTLMVNKRSGQTEYVVLKYNSDFLGLLVNERYYPLDWRELTYDRRVHGYGVDFTEDQLQDRIGYDADGRRVRRKDRDNRHARFAAWS